MNMQLKKGDVVGFVDVMRQQSSSPSSKSWHLVQISDGLDNVGVEFLRRLKIELYRPLMRSMKSLPRNQLSRSQRKAVLKPMREKIEPFFPGYAFIDYSESADRWREIFKMAHIRGLVCNNDLPVEVPWRMIAEIQGLEIDGAIPGTTKLFEMPYILGERVRVASGPFASFPGSIERLPTLNAAQLANTALEELDDSLRVHLLVDIFGSSRRVSLSLADIEKI
jgi:transcription antitermination factor NusG